MKKRIFGFDIGIASLGWAVIDFDDNADPENRIYPDGQIVKSGVRCFPIAENPKDGSSLAQPRRQKRLLRRLCRRKARRMAGIKALFVAKGLIDKEALSSKNKNNIYLMKDKADVWDLRVKALSEKLTIVEFIRVLTHLAKHRGFKSYRLAAEEKDTESGQVLKAIKNNKESLCDGKTLAQMIVEKGGLKRNRQDKDKNPTYTNSIPRDEIERETRLIFERQRSFGLSAASVELQADFEKIAFRFRPVAGVEKMLGKCLFEKNEYRAPKNAPSAEFFVAWTKINNCSVYENQEKRSLTPEERQAVFNLLKKQKEVKYAAIRKKIFAKRDGILFTDIEYNPKPIVNKKTGEIKEPKKPEDTKFYALEGYHKLKETIDISDKPIELLDKIVAVIATQKNDEEIGKELRKIGISEDDIKKLQGLTFKTFIKLSLKALYKILPEMEKGKKYNEACDAVGYDFRTTGESFAVKKGKFLPPIPENLQTTVPAVNRGISQFRKVYNAMVRQFGTPDQINVELARDVYNNHEERKQIEDRQKEYQNEKEQALAVARDKLGVTDVSGAALLKFRLYEQQDGKCIYSGEALDIRRLTEQDYCDVDHIIPYSRSQDNSQNNKVLCLSRENREKSNQTPREYIKDPVRWAEFCARVASMKNMNKAKKERLLMRNFADREQEFRERNINDTRYMARYMMKYLDDCIDFTNSKIDIKDRVQSRNGALTDFLRYQWGLTKNRNENDRHHAQDAIVIACATNRYTQYLAFLSKVFENKQAYAQKHGEAWYKAFKQQLKQPWNGFYEDVQKSLSEIFVSRPPRKNATGQVHEDRIRTLNPDNPKYSAKEVKSGIKVRGGLANNGNMLRVDVFSKKNTKGKEQFYLVPVYLADWVKPELPNKAIVAHKPENEWVQIDDTFQFKFSLYKDDLVKVSSDIMGYYVGTHRGTGAITIEAADRSQIWSGLGARNLDYIKKYQVDPLGNYVEVKSEKRLPLEKKSERQRKEDRYKRDFYKNHSE